MCAPIHTTQEELATVVKQVMEEVIDRHLHIMYVSAQRKSSPKLSPIGLLVGLDEICGFLHCSRPTALKQMDTILKPAVLAGKDGKRYMLDGDMALRLLQKNVENHRKASRHSKTKKHD